MARFVAYLLGGVIGFCVVILQVAAVIVWLGYFTVEGNLAAIESVRHDLVAAKGDAETAAIAPLAVRCNAWIAWHQRLNRAPYTEWAFSDQWDEVRPIRLRGLFRDEDRRPFPRPRGDEPTGWVPPTQEEFERTMQELRQAQKAADEALWWEATP